MPTAQDDTDERYSITIKGEIYLLVSQYTSNPPISLVDDLEHLITLHTKERELELQIYLLDKKLPSIIGYKNITSDIATRVSDQIIFLEAQLTNPTKGDNK